MKPHFLIPFLLFHLYLRLSHSAGTLPLQIGSLLVLKSSLQDPSNTFQDWDTSVTFSSSKKFHGPVWCSWSGITCNNRTTQITSLNLSKRNLSGLIPDEIRYLTSLAHLNLSGNLFDGPLPPFIFQLTNLKTLDISHNNFNATFPPGISRLRFLRIFNAYSNNFTGPLPKELTFLHYLEHLNLGGSYFQGEIPAGYGSFTRLKFLYLAGNSLEGQLPSEIGKLTQLQHLEIGYNLNLSGKIPREMGSLTNLNYLDISNSTLSGPLPEELGNLTSLQVLLLFTNKLTGQIPETFSNLKSVQILDLSDNHFTGHIPSALRTLTELTRLSLMKNQLTGEIPPAIGDLPNLNTLSLWNNSLTGTLPWTLGSNAKLQWLDVSSNSLSGSIPPNLCKGNKLYKLILFSNKFSDSLPNSLANCTSLSRFRIENNHLNGSIPSGFGQLPNLTYVDLSNNNFQGEIPRDFPNAPKLQYLNISNNPFNSTLPKGIWQAPGLLILSASFSSLVGPIPDFIECSSVYEIELSGNSLNGSIPWDIGHCQKLLSLNLSTNSLIGIIPWEISTLPSITTVDLSRNSLTGTIPDNFQNCTTLETFDVSYNLLTGPIPSSGSLFPKLPPSSFSGNEGLCGALISKPCAPETLGSGRPKKTAGEIVWIMAAAFGVGIFSLVAATRWLFCKKAEERGAGNLKITAFQRLNFGAEDVEESVSMTDKIIGVGSTGTVYKAEMPGGEIIAVKKLWGRQQKEGMRWGVLSEIQVLGSVRHRNIVRLLGYCYSDRECTMLLYEYMPNGNLEELLHGNKKGENLVGDWEARYKIALGVAQGICYLHHDCEPVIVHRDLKPSNILLDAEMEARVADFGLAKLMRDESMSVVAGSYGYIAPEYAYTLQVDEKSDIYSYGVVLMEIISGRRSVDSEFGEGNNVVDWVRSKIKTRDGVFDILDKNAGASIDSVREEMIQMLRIALLCTSRNPADRPSMRDVVLMLHEAKPKRKLNGIVVNGGDCNGCGNLVVDDDDAGLQKPIVES